MTYNKSDEPTTCVATGQGILRNIADDNTTMEWTTLYVPSATGTVLSPDRYVQDNKHHLFLFNHEGDIEGNGAIQFQNRCQQTILQIKMKRRQDGLWFTTNHILVPPLKQTIQTITQYVHNIPNNYLINKAHLLHCNPVGTNILTHLTHQQLMQRKNSKVLKDLEL